MYLCCPKGGQDQVERRRIKSTARLGKGIFCKHLHAIVCRKWDLQLSMYFVLQDQMWQRNRMEVYFNSIARFALVVFHQAQHCLYILTVLYIQYVLSFCQQFYSWLNPWNHYCWYHIENFLFEWITCFHKVRTLIRQEVAAIFCAHALPTILPMVLQTV